MAFAANKKKSYDPQTFRSNQGRGGYNTFRGGFTKGRGSFTQGRTSYKKTSPLYCDHCNFSGHTIDKCYKLHGYPKDQYKYYPQKKFAHCTQSGDSKTQDSNVPADEMICASFTKEQYSQILNLIDKPKLLDSGKQGTAEGSSHSAFFVGKLCLYSHHDSNWIIDSGAIDHFCYDLAMFSSYKLLPNKDNFITILDGKKVLVTHVGKVKLNTDIELEDVLYVLEFHFNLISVHKLCLDMSCEVTFNSHTCFLQGPTLTKTIALGKLRSGLYYANADSSLPPQQLVTPASSAYTASTNSNKHHDQAKLWHLKLGHLPFAKLSHIIPAL